ncbi:MAG: peroxide stress protein YaaA [Lachnospiraceae bacterium]|nr:peroxide stress protein YaaA [Lachnospiraceae bacterium]
MRILLSPAKKMKIDRDTLEVGGLPALLERTQEILEWLQGKSDEELQRLWKCNDKIARENVERLRGMQLYKELTPAILSYVGLAFQYMAPAVFEDGQLSYIEEHLRILSGFYGVLRPMDGVTPYRLEMQAKASVGGSRDLYDFWGRSLYEQVRSEDGVFINLASGEYSSCIERWIEPEDTYITCVFAEEVNGKMVQKGTYAKMARGEMVRFMAEHRIEAPEDMKRFDRLGFVFREDLSDHKEYVFERRLEKEKSF